MKIFSTIAFFLLTFMQGVTHNAHAFDVAAEIVIDGRVKINDSLDIFYNGIFLDVTKSGDSLHYLGVSHWVNDSVSISALVGTTALAPDNSMIVRGDVLYVKNMFTAYSFAEIYLNFKALGIFLNPEFAYKKFRAGAESYSYIDIANKSSTNEFGPLIGVAINKYLRLNAAFLLHDHELNPLGRIEVYVYF